MASETLVRRRPTRARPQTHRDSNLVRASVLETALELGFTQNSTVANWIFNNPLSEEPEDPVHQPDTAQDTKPDSTPDDGEVVMPGLMSRSSSTSDETSSLNSPSNNGPSVAITVTQISHARKPSVTESPHVHFGDFSSDQLQLFSPLTLPAHDELHEETRSNSLGTPSKDVERSRSQDDSLRHYDGHKSPSAGLGDSGYLSEGQYLSKEKTNRGRDKPAKIKGKGAKRVDTDKTSEKDGDYLSDGGYISASSNKSQGKVPGKVKYRAMAFFRRRPKKSFRGSDDEDEASIPPVPAIPVLPRPSSPKPLERRMMPSSPKRSGFTPLSLNLTSPPASPPRGRLSKSPPQAKVTPSQRLEYPSAPQHSPSPLVASTSAPSVLTPAATAATFPLPPSMPGTPLSTASFPAISATKSITTSTSRQHLSIPPPTPPPTFPLPQLPPSPSAQSNGILPPLPSTPTTPSRRAAPSRPVPVVPMTLAPTQPLVPRRAASPFRPLLSSRTSSPAVPQARNGELVSASEGDQTCRKESHGRPTLLAGLGSTPAFLQRRIQHGPPPSPRHPPPDTPLPPSPRPAPGTHPRTPIGPPSKFREHLSSISSVPSPKAISIVSNSPSPSPSLATLSGSSSGPSVRSSHVSSASGRSEEPVIRDSLNIPQSSRPMTSASVTSEVSYGAPITSTFSRCAVDVKSQHSYVSSSNYSPTSHQDSGGISIYDDDDAEVDGAAPKSHVDKEDDDASVYASDDKTAGRRTMYLVEHGELNENGDEVELAGNHYWDGQEMPPPVPPMPTRPGPGYF